MEALRPTLQRNVEECDLMVAGYNRSGVNAIPRHHLVSLAELAMIRR